MKAPDTVSQLDLLNELIRRVENGWQPLDQDKFIELYFDLTDAYERSKWHVADQRRRWPELER